MKRFSLCTLLLVSFNAMSGGVPVFDGVANTTSLRQWAEKLEQWKETATHYKNEIAVANDQLKTLRGIKDHIKNFNINSFVNDINSLDKLLPNYESIVNSNWNNDAMRLSEKLGIDDKCKSKSKSNAYKKIINLCKSENMNLAANYIVTDEINKQVNLITKQILTLSREVASSNEIKTTTDINNKIAIFNGQLETLDRKLSIVQQQYQMNKELIKTQREIQIRQINSAPTRESFKYFERAFKNTNKRNNSDGF